MATTPRRTRKSPSTTTPKSSQTPTEKPESGSPESEPQSDETSIQTETSSSSPSTEEDPNAELFAEADAQAQADSADAAPVAQDEPEDVPAPAAAPEAPQAKAEVVEGEVTTFEVKFEDLSPYTFKGVVSGNTITVVEDAMRSFRLPGSTSRGQVLAHHKGQLLPLSSFERFIKE